LLLGYIVQLIGTMQRLLIFVCVALIATRVTCTESGESGMTDEEARQLLDEYYNNAANQDVSTRGLVQQTFATFAAGI
jgi:hypothetical protein